MTSPTIEENIKLKDRLKFALLGYCAGMYEWNMSDNTAFYSDEWKELLGYKHEDITPHLSTWKNLVHPDDIDDIMNNVNETVKAKRNHIETVHRLRKKDGTWIWILGRGFIKYNENGNPIKMIGFHTDITKQKTDELKLKHQAKIIEQVHDSIISINFDGDILMWNNGSKIIFGYTAKEILGKNFSILCINKFSNEFKNNIQYTIQNNLLKTEEILKTKDKKIINTKITMYILKDDKNKPISITMHIQDITNEINAKKVLLEEKKNLEFKAMHDPLTKLPNRLLFTDRLQISILKAKRNNLKIALFFIDLDNFKEINDSFGHDIGDIVLKKTSQRLKESIRQEDTLSRLGGDEFTIIFENLKAKDDALMLAKKIQKSLLVPISIENQNIHISCSIGISFYPDNATDKDDLLKYADLAMYKSKAKRKGGFYHIVDTSLLDQ